MQNMRDMRERERTWHQCRKKHEKTNVQLFTTGKKQVRFPLLAAPANTYGFKCSLRKPRKAMVQIVTVFSLQAGLRQNFDDGLELFPTGCMLWKTRIDLGVERTSGITRSWMDVLEKSTRSDLFVERFSLILHLCKVAAAPRTADELTLTFPKMEA